MENKEKNGDGFFAIKFIFLIIGVPIIIIAGMIVGVYYLVDYTTGGEEGKEKRHTEYLVLIEEKEKIKNMIDTGLTCQYVAELRMKYAGEVGFDPLDDNYIEKKLRMFWNISSCGEEWNWWD